MPCRSPVADNCRSDVCALNSTVFFLHINAHNKIYNNLFTHIHDRAKPGCERNDKGVWFWAKRQKKYVWYWGTKRLNVKRNGEKTIWEGVGVGTTSVCVCWGGGGGAGGGGGGGGGRGGVVLGAKCRVTPGIAKV